MHSFLIFERVLTLFYPKNEIQNLVNARRQLTTNMRVSITLLEIFVVAILVALLITIESVTRPVQILATILVSPIIVLSLVFVYFCEKQKSGVLPELRYWELSG